MLTGRSQEQAALLRLVDSVKAGMSAALVLRGEGGVGKTALLNFLLESADSAEGVRVVQVPGLESETRLDFAAIHRLLVPFLDEVATLPPVQASALQTALGLSDTAPANSFLLGLSVLTILSNVTRDLPLLVVVD